MPKYHIASIQEWECANSLFENSNKKTSGYKLSKKNNNQLDHSFLYLANENKTKVVSIAKHYYLGEGSFGKAKIAEDEYAQLYTLKIQKKPIEDNEKQCLEKMGYLEFSSERESKSGKKYYVLQKYFEGITLEEYLALNSEMNEQQKNGLFQLLIQAIQELHDENIIHGDIKPNNFIVYNDENNKLQIKAIDFGASQILKNEQITCAVNQAVGAIKYRAPEAGKIKRFGPATLSKESDIYALGVLAKEDLKLNTPCIQEMYSNEAKSRISLNDALKTMCDVASPPKVERTERLKLIYQQALAQLTENEKTTIEINLANEIAETRKFTIKVDNKNELQKIDEKSDILKNWTCNYGMKFYIDDQTQATVLSPSQLVDAKYHNYSLQQLLDISGTSLKEIKDNLLEAIRKIVRLTNDIQELEVFFIYLKSSEYSSPILRKERGLFMKMFGDSGMTNSWKEALNIFKERAMELARNEANLNEVINNSDKYTTILKEERARILRFKSSRLEEYESLVNKINN
ncbi:MAG: protein kinase family protein [Tatlockia sp.]|nr:protein kinase family protein [Tatlockia sp.]